MRQNTAAGECKQKSLVGDTIAMAACPGRVGIPPNDSTTSHFDDGENTALVVAV